MANMGAQAMTTSVSFQLLVKPIARPHTRLLE